MPRRLAALLAAACLAILLVSTWAMARRVAAFNSSGERPHWVLQGVDERTFEFAGRPVSIEDRPAGAREAVVIAYGPDTLTIPATIPPRDPRLPGLKRHEDWLQFIRFADRARLTAAEFRAALDAGQVRDRLTAVVRRPLADDPRTLGQGWKKQWEFDFYEFDPAGGFRTQTWKYPSGRTIDPVKEGHLIEGTWQYAAALAVMPKLRKPNPKFTNDALHAMEWTLPAAAFSGLGLLVFTLVLAAPQRPRP